MLQVEHLSYDVLEEGKQSEILNDVSFTVNDGEMLVITGPNGGGKSTLAKLLMGINKASSGKILLNGEDITEYTIDERAKAGIGFAFQQPPRFKGMTVRRLLSLAAGHPLDEKTCCNLLSSVGLCAMEYIDRERMLRFPAVRSKESRSLQCLQNSTNSVFLMSRRQELISGAFPC